MNTEEENQRIKNDLDIQFLCKDCERYPLCEYYDNRKETSFICKYFHLDNIYFQKHFGVDK